MRLPASCTVLLVYLVSLVLLGPSQMWFVCPYVVLSYYNDGNEATMNLLPVYRWTATFTLWQCGLTQCTVTPFGTKEGLPPTASP